MLEAHHIFFDKKNFLEYLFKTVSLGSDSVNFRFPIYLIFLAPNNFKCIFVSLLETKHRSNLLNSFFADDPSLAHFLKDLLFILAFKSIKGIDSCFILVSILGHISESIKIAKEGDQYFKNFFTKNKLSIGKN